VPDPWARRGVRHTFMSILLVAAAAVLAGARSFTAMGEWAGDAPQHVLETLGTRHDRLRGRYQAPGEATLRRGLHAVDGDLLDIAIGAWLASLADAVTAIAVDGKPLRGTCDETGQGGVHLLAAMTHDDGIVVAQQEVDGKPTRSPPSNHYSTPSTSPASSSPSTRSTPNAHTRPTWSRNAAPTTCSS
jgi:hypothetical protein